MHRNFICLAWCCLSLLTLKTCRLGIRGSCPGSKAHVYSLFAVRHLAAAAVPHYDALGTGLSLPAGNIATEHRGHNITAMKDMHAT